MVSDVYLGGPAHIAGILPGSKDFILGTREICFKSLEEFEKYIIVNENQEIKFYIYNSEFESFRVLNLTPNKEWGGIGLLGCDVSFGYFNIIPLREKDMKRINNPDEIEESYEEEYNAKAENEEVNN